MATEKRLIDANAIPWEEYYVPDPDSNDQWDYKKELTVTKPVIDKMPIVDAVEVVHGRWEDMYGGKYENPRFRCSLCKKKALYVPVQGLLGNWSDTQTLSKYCPNCGAKMDGDRNG